MKNLYKISLLLVLLTSCGKNGRTIILNTQNADGLTTETKLDVNGFEIGEVVEMKLAKDGTINLTCDIKNEIEIPVDSKFYTKNLGLLRGKGIGIILGSENEKIESGATVKMTVKKLELSRQEKEELETAKNDIERAAALRKYLNLSEQKKVDSLISELKRIFEKPEGKRTIREQEQMDSLIHSWGWPQRMESIVVE